MKVGKLKGLSIIEVGDFIEIDNWCGKRHYRVHRVTAKFAMVMLNATCEGKYRRKVDSTGFVQEAGNKDLWSTTKYTAWREVKDEEKGEG